MLGMPDRVDVEHPAVAERDEAPRSPGWTGSASSSGLAESRSGPGVRPGGQEAPVLQEAYAVVHQGRVVEEIGEALGLRRPSPSISPPPRGRRTAAGAWVGAARGSVPGTGRDGRRSGSGAGRASPRGSAPSDRASRARPPS